MHRKLSILIVLATLSLFCKVTDAADSPTYTGVMDFGDGVDIAAEYHYDSNGNATCDLNRGITSITYNQLDLPSQITFSTGATIQYLYDADGRKLNVTHSPPPLSSSGQTTTEYCDNIIYKGGAVDWILTDEGYITLSASGIPTYHYFLRNHLGSVNVVLDSSGTVEETTHYYPYSTTFPQTSVQPYKFCGKELDRVHGLDWYDSQARMYDPVLARWHTQDSKAEDYYNWSPYAYCMGNPVNAIDPDGNSVWTKLAKASVKIGKQVAKHGAKALTEGATYTQAVADITDDINTLTDSEASTGSKVWAGISLASEALPLSVNDVKDAGKVIKRSVHGNSKMSTRAQHAYDIVDKETNTIVKTGVSGGGKRVSDWKSQRAESQVRKWNKEVGRDKYESVITHEIPEGKGAREKILKYEKKRADELRRQSHLHDIDKHQKP